MRFNEWLNEQEVYSSRLERFFDESCSTERMLEWLEAAWQVGFDHALGNLIDDGK